MRKYIAEFICTFVLVFCGTGAIIVSQQSPGSFGLLGIAIAFGAVVTAMIYAFGNISGAHMNPSVTIALAIGKFLPKKEVAFYIISQILGAFAASSLLKSLFPENETLGATLPSGSEFQSFAIELLMTFILMLTILGVIAKKEFSSVAGMVIGMTVTGIIMFSGPISGGSFNPARSLAPAILSGHLEGLWIYIVAPTLATVSAVFIWNFLNVNEDSEGEQSV